MAQTAHCHARIRDVNRKGHLDVPQSLPTLLLIAHGSRRSEANDEVRRTADALAAALSDTYAAVRVAFLELAEPSIPDAVATLALDGVRAFDVLPWLLSAGAHVQEDVPQLLHAAAAEHQLAVRLLPHLGGLDGFPEAVAELLKRSF
ncbi:MAG: cobalamin biosynthesis protein CbiX [Candidatus Dadabacteria bacterium]|nr:MAG: cobalamin biosynthesis protein CbiX [Candidatus Dadabacteria bacterium]